MKLNYGKRSLLIMILGILGTAQAARAVTIDDNWVKQNGSTVTGTFSGTTATPAINVTTQLPVTIRNATVSGTGDLILLSAGSDVSVINTLGTELNSNISGEFNGSFIRATRVANLSVKNCTVTGVYFGVYVQGFTGDTAAGQTIKILNNVFNNIDGRVSDGKGGYVLDDSSHAHAIQLNAVRGVRGIEIAWNQTIETPYQSLINDTINLYSSSGTSASPIIVHDNYIQGPMGASPGNGQKYSGGGIITDGSSTDTASTTSAWVNIYNNQVVSTANYGLAIASGHDISVYNNRVVSAGHLANGTSYAMTFAQGAYNWSSHSQPSTVFYNNNVHDNVLGLLRPNASGQLARSDWWLPGQTSTGNNQHLLPNDASHPSHTDEQNEYASWQQKLAQNGIVIGVVQQNMGTLSLMPAANSDSRCASATDILYLDGASAGKSFTVSSGFTATEASGTHQLALASASVPISAGNGQTGTCSGKLNNSSVVITAGQTSALTATWLYSAPASQSCVVTASIVNGTGVWDVKVDSFHEEVTLTGFPKDSNGKISVNGTLSMKNNFKINFWTNQGFQTSFTGSNGSFTGSLYGSGGTAAFTVDGFLIDGTPIVMDIGAHPLKSMTVNGIACSVAFPLKSCSR